MFVALLLSSIFPLQALQLIQVAPRATDPQIEEIRGPHTAMQPDIESAESPLLITLGGTNSAPNELLEFGGAAAELGYFVIGVDYPNGVITTACRQGNDDECFDDFRAEIVMGTDESTLVNVNRSNSVLYRIQRLLVYLSTQDPKWSRFVQGDFVNWKNVVVAGHSQGSGHAAFLAKHYPVKRAILFSGPQDVAVWGQARWLSAVSATPGDRFFALLHAQDSFGSEWQIRALQRLSMQASPQVLKIGDDVPAGTSANILVSELNEQNAHMAPITPRYKKVWNWLLRRQPEVITTATNK